MQWRDALSAGSLVGERYRILKPLARGGFGAVYEAEQLTTERRVAVKVLFRYPDDVSVDRMLDEARLASRLTSEHVVQVIDAGIDLASSAVYVAMELLSGVTLGELVEQHGPLAPAEAAELLRQLAAGLDKAHGYVDRERHPRPIIHRDLKPANLFVTRRDDGTALLKILDFGTAKLSSSAAAAPSSGVVRGTPQYMAPEQISGERVTAAVDVWAFGLLGFYLLSGRSYWHSVQREAPTEALFAEMLTLPLMSASERAHELGVTADLSRLDDWFARAVHRTPSARFASAGEAAREFARAFSVATAPVPATALGVEARSDRDPAIATAAPAPPPADSAPTPEADQKPTQRTDEHAALTRPFATTKPSQAWTAVAVGTLLLAGGVLAWFQSAARSPADQIAKSHVAPAEPAAPASASSAPEDSRREGGLRSTSPARVPDVPVTASSGPPTDAKPPAARPRIVKERNASPKPSAMTDTPPPSRPKPSVYEIR